MGLERWVRGGASVALILILAGCAASTPAPAATSAVAVTDPSVIAGKWMGLMELEGGGDREDFIELTVDRDATYRASSSRTIGLLDAQGKVVVAGGALRLQGVRGGAGTATLYQGATAADRSLLVVGTTPSGRRFNTRLRPATP